MQILKDIYLLKKSIDKLKELQFSSSLLGIFLNPLYIARANLYKNIKKIAPFVEGKILDVGCGQKPYKKLFTNVKEYIGIDVEVSGHDHSNSEVDLYYNGKDIPFKDEEFDSVLTNQVLEHVFEADDFLNEINRVLKKGGLLLITFPFVWDEHEQPYDFARYTSFGIKYLLEKTNFEIVDHIKSVNSIALIYQLLNLYFYKIIMKKKSILRFLFCLFLSVPNNIIGTILSVVLPKNNDLYLDNIIVARKK